MADQKTSELTEKTTLVDADYFPFVDSEASPIETKRVLRSNLASLVVWKDASENAMTDGNRTSTLGYTDLDLTAYTSAIAKLALVRLRIHVDTITPVAYAYLGIRKNGTTPSAIAVEWLASAKGDIAGVNYSDGFWIIGVDSGQVIEYTITISGTIQVDSYIDVLGYIE